MTPIRWLTIAGFSALGATLLIHAANPAFDNSDVKNVITGKEAFDDYRSEKPGIFRKITAAAGPLP